MQYIANIGAGLELFHGFFLLEKRSATLSTKVQVVNTLGFVG